MSPPSRSPCKITLLSGCFHSALCPWDSWRLLYVFARTRHSLFFHCCVVFRLWICHNLFIHSVIGRCLCLVWGYHKRSCHEYCCACLLGGHKRSFPTIKEAHHKGKRYGTINLILPLNTMYKKKNKNSIQIQTWSCINTKHEDMFFLLEFERSAPIQKKDARDLYNQLPGHDFLSGERTLVVGRSCKHGSGGWLRLWHVSLRKVCW